MHIESQDGKKNSMKYKRQVNNTSITKEGLNAYDIQSI